jgi:hypothetical protein
MVQMNAPYPATAYLAGFLEQYGHEVHQADAALMLALRLFSSQGIGDIKRVLKPRSRSASVQHFLRNSRQFASTIDPVILFLQGRNPALDRRILSRKFLPEGPRFSSLDNADTTNPAHAMTEHEWAILLASLYLDDLADAIRDGVDSRFELARYGEKLAASAPSFDGIDAALRRNPTLVDTLIDQIAETLFRKHKPTLAGFTLPFPGNVFGALRMARVMKRLKPGLAVVMGGGFVNTELRNLKDPRIFDYTDYLTLDDGELPLLRIVEHLEGQAPASSLIRTYIRQNNHVRYVQSSEKHPLIFNHQSSIPLFSSLPLDYYFSMIESLNPMHRIWSCGRWNKLMLAHGCYWHRCAFCDTGLDYISRFSPADVGVLVKQIQTVIKQTGQTGFHFIDEAMPPALLRALSNELIKRKIRITWWGNIRFDKAFTPELAKLMAKAGCIAVTGGLEAATNRLLKLLDKGFTLDQAATVTHGFSEAGILVHAYLMYGCPTQTEQDTIDSLEYVRQLFEAGCLQSAYWHRFALTIHSPIFKARRQYGIRLLPHPKPSFASNEVPFKDTVRCDHDALGRGLRKALYNYMHLAGLDSELQMWFDSPIPPPTLPTDFVTGLIH